MRKKKYSLHRYLRHLPRHTVIEVSIETHALLVTYAAKHNYTLREAANRAIVGGLALDLAQEDARKKRKETEELL